MTWLRYLLDRPALAVGLLVAVALVAVAVGWGLPQAVQALVGVLGLWGARRWVRTERRRGERARERRTFDRLAADRAEERERIVTEADDDASRAAVELQTDPPADDDERRRRLDAIGWPR